MKARIPLPNDLKSAVKTEIAAEWKKIQKEKALEMAQRCLKVYLSGLPLAYRTTKIIRYKGHVELHPIWGMTINLQNRCQWWRNLNYDDDSINSDRLEVIGNIYDDNLEELVEGKS